MIRSTLLCLSLWLLPALTLAQASDEEARGLYLAGEAAFTEGRYDDALGHFQRSYELSGRPELLYNIAQ